MEQQAQIIPEFVNPRSEMGGANIKANGAKWYIPDGAVNLFQKGQSVNVVYTQKQSQRTGKPYYTITAVNGQPLSGMQPAGQAVPAQFQPPPQWTPPLPASPPPPPGPTSTRPYYPAAPFQHDLPTTPIQDTSEEIFVTGIVGRAMGSGKFDIQDIRYLAKEATHAWRERTQPMPQSHQPGDELDDGWPGPDTGDPGPGPLS